MQLLCAVLIIVIVSREEEEEEEAEEKEEEQEEEEEDELFELPEPRRFLQFARAAFGIYLTTLLTDVASQPFYLRLAGQPLTRTYPQIVNNLQDEVCNTVCVFL